MLAGRRRTRWARRIALLVAAAVVFLVLAPAGALAETTVVDLSDVAFRVLTKTTSIDLEEDQATAGDIVELTVEAEKKPSADPQSVQVAFFYTEERSKRHNLIGVATTRAITADVTLRPTVYWDTTLLTPGIYEIEVFEWKDGAPTDPEANLKGEETLKILREDETVVWPSIDGALGYEILGKEALFAPTPCTLNWTFGLDTNPPFVFTNLGTLDLQTLSVNVEVIVENDAWDEPQSQALPDPEVDLEPVAAGERGTATITLPYNDLFDGSFAAVFDATPADANGFRFIDLDAAFSMSIGFTIRPGANGTPAFDPDKILLPTIEASWTYSIYPRIRKFVFPSPAACCAPTIDEEDAAPCPAHAISDVTVAPVVGPSGIAYLAAGNALYELTAAGGFRMSIDLGAGGGVVRRPVWGYKPSDQTRTLVFVATADGRIHALEGSTLGYEDVGFAYAGFDGGNWASGILTLDSADVAQPQVLRSESDLVSFLVVGSADGIWAFDAAGRLWKDSFSGYDIDTDSGIVVATKNGTDLPGYAFFFGKEASNTQGGTTDTLYAADLTRSVTTGTVPTIGVKGIYAVAVFAGTPSTPLSLRRIAGKEYVLFGTENGEVIAIDAEDAWNSTDSAGFATNVSVLRWEIASGAQATKIVGVEIVEQANAYTLYANTARLLYRVELTTSPLGLAATPTELAPSLSRSSTMTSAPLIGTGLITGENDEFVFVRYGAEGNSVIAGFVVRPGSVGDVEIHDLVVRVWEPAGGVESMKKNALYARFRFPVEGATEPVLVSPFGPGSPLRYLYVAGSGPAGGLLHGLDLTTGAASETALFPEVDLQEGASTIPEGAPSG